MLPLESPAGMCQMPQAPAGMVWGKGIPRTWVSAKPHVTPSEFQNDIPSAPVNCAPKGASLRWKGCWATCILKPALEDVHTAGGVQDAAKWAPSCEGTFVQGASGVVCRTHVTGV